VSQELERAEVDQLAERWRAAWTGVGAFADCCTTEVSYEDPLTYVPLTGTAALEERAVRLRAAFPDVKVDLTAPALGRGDHACLPWRLAGTHRGEIAMVPPTDSFVTLHGLHYVELADGRIRRARGFFDLYDGAIQLGLLPGHGGLGEATLMLLRGFGMRR
jgi:steroid delta-isomerase-like uncharacterized protein